ncbi:UNVERIFIED_CONTAM: hypothetical protein FKN15_033072 [Acipenser sinensis]
MPKLWLLLKEGGRGLATVLHPNLLPFISKLPDEITDPKLEFYNTFFSSVILGLSSERAVSSPSECSAIIFAFMECLRFSLLQNAGAEDEHKKVQQMLISDQLLLLVESALKNPRLQSSPLFYQITDMLVSWEKRVNPSSEGTAEDTFQRLLSDFWDGVTRLCVQQVDRTDAEENALNGVSTLLQVMQSPEGSWKQCKKKAIKIRFAGLEGAEVKDDDDEDDLPTVSKSPSDSTLLVERSDPGSERPHSQNRRLEDLVCELAELNMVYVNEQRSDKHLKFLSVLVSSFPSRRLFQVLLDSDAQNQETGLGETSLQEKTMAANPAVQFLLQKLIIWLKEDQRKDTDFLVNMLYSVLHCCDSNEEKKLILDHISKMDLKWSILLQIIQKACADEAKFEATSDWLKGEVLGEKLVKLAEDLCAIGLNRISTLKSSHSDSWALISLALSQHVQKKTLIGEVYVEKIIEKLHATLLKAKNLSDAGDIEPLVSFICDVASNFFCSVKNCLLLSSAEDLLLTVFQLCAQSQEITHLSGKLLFCTMIF